MVSPDATNHVRDNSDSDMRLSPPISGMCMEEIKTEQKQNLFSPISSNNVRPTKKELYTSNNYQKQ